MTSLQNIIEIRTEPTAEFTDGLYISAYRHYESYSDTLKYYITVTDWESLEDIAETETTAENMQRDLNRMLQKYHINTAHIEHIEP